MQVADFIKNDRLNRLNAVVNEVVEERAQRFKGCKLEVSHIYRDTICALRCLAAVLSIKLCATLGGAEHVLDV